MDAEEDTVGVADEPALTNEVVSPSSPDPPSTESTKSRLAPTTKKNDKLPVPPRKDTLAQHQPVPGKPKWHLNEQEGAGDKRSSLRSELAAAVVVKPTLRTYTRFSIVLYVVSLAIMRQSL